MLGLIARRIDALQQLRQQLPSEALLYPLDVRDARALHCAAADFMARHGCPDIVYANAGMSVGTLTEFSEDLQAFQDVIDVNVLGMVKTFQPFLSAMRNARQGTLVGIASVAGYRGLPGSGAYCASKAGAIAYLESLRVELRGSGVNVLTICPGYIATAMTARNPYRMPFMLSADAAADRIAAIVARRRAYAVIPWQMAIVARILRVLPNWLYDRGFGGLPRKPRR